MRRFIDRCYTEKTANLFLESCRDWMNKINEGREYYSEEFKEQQFLTLFLRKKQIFPQNTPILSNYNSKTI